MSKTIDFTLEDDLGDVADRDLINYALPSDIVDDPEITLARKRELLAHWASDIHAVPNHPALRRLRSGTTAVIDEIQMVLRRLDTMVPPEALPAVSGFGVPK